MDNSLYLRDELSMEPLLEYNFPKINTYPNKASQHDFSKSNQILPPNSRLIEFSQQYPAIQAPFSTIEAGKLVPHPCVNLLVEFQDWQLTNYA